MEHNAIQWVGAPSCQRGSYAFYKSVSSRAQPDGPLQVWKLGEFYFIQCGPEDPICIAEVTLLWEDQARRHLLASARLYFLPEDTPKGRTREHGEDEVLAVSRKMVVRVEDLVKWSRADLAGWSGGPMPPVVKTNGVHEPPQSGGDNNGGVPSDNNELLEVKTEDEPSQRQTVKVLSYPQYCRFRSLQRRIQDGARGPALQDTYLLALGAIKVLPNIRVMYCRDTFNHPTLESSACFSWQFKCPSLSLRGRPRKRKGRDSKDSPTSGQPESWIEKMKENVMGSVEVGCEGSWLPHPEEQLFLDQLFIFMERHGSPIHKVPNLGFKKIDLFLMYSVVKRLGGYKKVTSDRLWKVVYNELGGCPGSTSAATCTRRHYERLMLPYEEHLRAGGGAEFKIPDVPLPSKPRGIRGRKPLPRGRKPGPKPKERRTGTLSHAAPPSTPIQPAFLPLSMPLTPDLSPMSPSFLPFKTTELKSERSDSAAPPPPSVLIPALPHFVTGSLSSFSPIKGVCPLDVFRSQISLQRGPDSLALTPQDPAQLHPAIFTLQPKGGSPDTPQPSSEQLQPQLHQLHQQHCSGCGSDNGGQRGVSRSRPPLPPLRVLPLNLDCSVQVRKVMRAHLDSSQLQTFTRRLSEALSQDLNAKPPCSPITPPPEQALPLNLSKRLPPKRPSAEGHEQSPQAVNRNLDPSYSKRPRSGPQEQAQDFSLRGCSSSLAVSGVQSVEGRGQEEPADLSSPSRIRAFLLGLPPFQVKLEEDMNGTRFVKIPPPNETRRTEVGDGDAKTEAKKQEEPMGKEQPERDPTRCPGPMSEGPASDTDTHCF
uniref:Zgc:77151 n=1 Tax=Poecilia reticulata TaxID=8081 RepID=A0A3P9PAR8_POERE